MGNKFLYVFLTSLHYEALWLYSAKKNKDSKIEQQNFYTTLLQFIRLNPISLGDKKLFYSVHTPLILIRNEDKLNPIYMRYDQY